ncbi:MAG: hypothetical protein AVDCRST_MAG11-3040, partial [uncultured Gemmatimonadaceae bacterium]
GREATAPRRRGRADEQRRSRVQDHAGAGAEGRHHGQSGRQGAVRPLPRPARRFRPDEGRFGRL